MLRKLKDSLTQSVSSIPQNIGNVINAPSQLGQNIGRQVIPKIQQTIQQAPRNIATAAPQFWQGMNTPFGAPTPQAPKIPFLGQTPYEVGQTTSAMGFTPELQVVSGLARGMSGLPKLATNIVAEIPKIAGPWGQGLNATMTAWKQNAVAQGVNPKQAEGLAMALPLMVGHIQTNGGVNAKTVNSAKSMFVNILKQAEGDINKKYVPEQVAGAIEKLAKMDWRQARNVNEGNLIKLASFIKAAESGALSNIPTGIGLTVKNIREGQKKPLNQGVNQAIPKEVLDAASQSKDATEFMWRMAKFGKEKEGKLLYQMNLAGVRNFEDIPTAGKGIANQTINDVGAKVPKVEDFLSAQAKTIPKTEVPGPTVTVEKLGGASSQGSRGVPPSGTSIPDQDLISRLTQVLKTAEPIRGTQEQLYTKARGQQLAKMMSAREKMAGEKGFFQELGALKGELPKVQYESIRKEFDQPSVDRLFNMIKENNKLDEWEKINAQVGLAKILGEKGGGVPTQGEIEKLYQVYGKDFTEILLSKRPIMSKLGELAMQAYNIPRSFMAGIGDLSGTLMQNAMFAYRHPVMTAKNFVQELKFFASEDAFKMSGEEIASRPNYQLMKQAKLSLTDVGPTVSQREEQFMGSLAEKIPGLGRLVRATGRAYTGFLNRMRADTFDYMVGVQKGMGGNIEDAKFLKDTGHFINIATGRGDLGQLERIAPVVGQGLFSARKLMATFQTLDPRLYFTATPAVRREALLTMLSFMGGATAITQLSKLAGAEVSDDPTNTDYGKIKFGNTRFNMYGPYQQLAVLFARLWKGYATSSTTGKKMMLGDESNPYAPTRLDLLTRYFESKEHPTLSLIFSAMRGTNSIGQPFNLAPEVLGRFIPMVLGDAYDLYQEHGPIGLLGTVPGILGIPVQTYGSQIPSIGTTPTGRPNVKLNPVPNLEQSIVNKVTGAQESNIPQNQWQGFINAKEQSNQQSINMQEAKQALQTGQGSTGLTQTTFNIDGQDYNGFKVGDKFVYVDENGVQQTKSVKAIEKSKTTSQLDLYTTKLTNLKDKEDYRGWLTVANDKLNLLNDQYQKATKEVDKLDLENKITDLKTSIAKYKGYGGFTKPKRAAKITIKAAPKVRVKFPALKAGKITIAKPPTTKKITVAANTKANVVNKKFKITKATVKFKKVKYA